MEKNNQIINKLDADIIGYLTTCHEYCDSYEIARAVGINRRQVRSEISIVKEILASMGYTLDSKRSKGYRILEREKITELQNYVRSLTSGDAAYYEPQGRRDYMTEVLIMNDDTYIKLDDFADALFVSRSTIHNDLEQSIDVYEHRGCKLEKKARQGIRITGSEKNKRALLCDTLFNINTQNNSHVSFLEIFMNPKCELEYSILSIIKNRGIIMSDLAMCDFLLYLTVLCMRVRKGNMLEESVERSKIQNRREYDIASLIAVRISQYLDILLNEHEVNQIAVKIIVNQSSSNIELTNSKLTEKIYQESIRRIRERTGILLDDPKNLDQFFHYIDSTLMILSFKEKVRNPFYNTIQERYPLAYDLALIVKEVFEELSEYHLSSSFIAFFTVFFRTCIQEIRFRRRKVLLLSALGVSAANSIQKELEFRFGRDIKIIDKSVYYELPDKDLQNYDMIISTMPFPREISIPYTVISQFLTKEDLSQIESVITSDYSQFHPEAAYCPSLFSSGVQVKSMHDINNVMMTLICSLFTKLKKSYVISMLESGKNYVTDLRNGFLFIRLEKPLNSQDFAVAVLLKEPFLYESSMIYAVSLVSGSDRTYYRALREASRALAKQELIELCKKEKPPYSEFIGLYQEEW